jgi:hypothetical protein
LDKRGPSLRKWTEIRSLARQPHRDVADNPTDCTVGTTDKGWPDADDDCAQQQENPAVGERTRKTHVPIADSNPTG